MKYWVSFNWENIIKFLNKNDKWLSVQDIKAKNFMNWDIIWVFNDKTKTTYLIKLLRENWNYFIEPFSKNFWKIERQIVNVWVMCDNISDAKKALWKVLIKLWLKIESEKVKIDDNISLENLDAIEELEDSESSWEFQKYISIENSYREKYIKIIKENIPNDEIFILQEKIHGSNYSFQITKDNGFKIMPAWRDWLLKPEDNKRFYNHLYVFNKFKDNIMQMFNSINKELYNWKIENFAIYWELFWWTYNHVDVKNLNWKVKIQKWIFYTNDNSFLSFDIQIDGKYMNLLEVEKYCNRFNVPFDPILFSWTLDECLNYPNDFQSIIWPKLFNLPVIEDNVVEWTVIKPINEFFTPNWKRIIIKNKNDKWKEKIKSDKIKIQVVISKEWENLLKILLSHVTESRVDNVFSKLGIITNKDFWKVLWLYSKDVMEEFNKDYSLSVIVNKEELKKIKRILQKNISVIIRNKFKQEVV